jgi:hypothetical protein
MLKFKFKLAYRRSLPAVTAQAGCLFPFVETTPKDVDAAFLLLACPDATPFAHLEKDATSVGIILLWFLKVKDKERRTRQKSWK